VSYNSRSSHCVIARDFSLNCTPLAPITITYCCCCCYYYYYYYYYYYLRAQLYQRRKRWTHPKPSSQKRKINIIYRPTRLDLSPHFHKVLNYDQSDCEISSDSGKLFCEVVPKTWCSACSIILSLYFLVYEASVKGFLFKTQKKIKQDNFFLQWDWIKI